MDVTRDGHPVSATAHARDRQSAPRSGRDGSCSAPSPPDWRCASRSKDSSSHPPHRSWRRRGSPPAVAATARTARRRCPACRWRRPAAGSGCSHSREGRRPGRRRTRREAAAGPASGTRQCAAFGNKQARWVLALSVQSYGNGTNIAAQPGRLPLICLPVTVESSPPKGRFTGPGP